MRRAGQALFYTFIVALVLLSVVAHWQNAPKAQAASAVARMSAGSFHSCAVYGASNAVKCWGRNTWGSLGDNQACGVGACPTPVDVCATGASPPCNAGNSNILTGVTSIASGSEHTCAVVAGGAVKCWGLDDNGELGNGTTGPDSCGADTCSKTPVDVCAAGQSYPCGLFLTGAIYVVAGTDHTCALITGGGVKCWGKNASGQLGNNNAPYDSFTPVDVCANITCSGLLSGAGGIASAGASSCAVVAGNTLECWGQNDYGQLGDNNAPTNRAYAANVCADSVCGGSLTGVSFAGGGWLHMCAVVAGGAVKCWGANFRGQVGDGTTTDRAAPVSVCANTLCSAYLTGAFGAGGGPGGGERSCALMSSGAAKCWGLNDHGQLGIGTSSGPQSCSGSPCSTTPLDVCNQTCSAPLSGLSTTAIGALGGLHGCGVTAAGNILCGGDNDYGEVGDGTSGTDRTSVVPVVGFSSKGTPPTATPTPVPPSPFAGTFGCHTGQMACPPLGDNGPASNATLYTPTGLSDNGTDLYIADTNNCRIRKITAGVITTVAGNGTCGYLEANDARNAELDHPRDVFLKGTDLYIADMDNCRIRVVANVNSVTPGPISTVAGVGGAGNCAYLDGAVGTAKLNHPTGVAVSAVGTTIYIADRDNCLIRKVAAGTVSTIAGTGTCGFAGDDGPATSAQLNSPNDVALLLPTQALVIADTCNNRIRTYDLVTHVIATIAGSGSTGCGMGAYSGDGGLAASARLNAPQAVTALAGLVYIADTGNSRIRRVSITTHVISALFAANQAEGVSVPSGGGGAGAAGQGEAAGPGTTPVTVSDPLNHVVGTAAGTDPNGNQVGNFVPTQSCGGPMPGIGSIDWALPAAFLGLIATRKRFRSLIHRSVQLFRAGGLGPAAPALAGLGARYDSAPIRGRRDG